MKKVKEKIIETSRVLFCQQGVQSTSINDILLASGTGKGQFYYYFESKNELCLEVIKEHIEHWEIDCFQAILEVDENPKQQIKKMLDWIYDSHKDQLVHYGCPIGNLIAELATSDEADRGLLNQWLQRWQDLLAGLMIRMQNITENEALIKAQGLIAQIQGSILLLKVRQDIDFLKINFQQIEKELAL